MMSLPAATLTPARNALSPSEPVLTMFNSLQLLGLGTQSALELFQRAIESANCGIVIADMQRSDSPLIYCNPAFEIITGYDREQVIGRNCRFLQGPDTDPATIETLRQAIRAEQSCQVVLKNYRQNGQPFWNELELAPVRDGAGVLTHYIGVQTDITQGRQDTDLQHQQLRGELLLADIIERIRQSLDLETVLNTAVEEVRDLLATDRVVVYRFESDWTGLVVAESAGADWTVSLGKKIIDTCFVESHAIDYQQGRICAIADIETSPLTECHKAMLRRFEVRANLVLPIADESKLWGLLIVHHCRGARVWSDVEIHLLQRLAQQLAIAVRQAELYQQAQDEIARRQKAEADLAEKASQLELALTELKWQQTRALHSAKLASLGQLVAGVAHELNNPVSFIYGNVTYAREYTEDLIRLLRLYHERADWTGPATPEWQAAIEEAYESIDLAFIESDLPRLMSSIRAGAERIQQIVLSLRIFSRLQEAERKPVDLQEGLESVLLLLGSRLNPTSEAESEASQIEVVKHYGDLPPVTCYASQLNQVLMNVLENAIDALEEAIETGTLWSQGDRPRITLTTGRSLTSNAVQIRIQDNGVGIAPDVLPRVFDPFFTTKPVGKGMGMGLSIAYQVITDRHRGKIGCTSCPGEGTEVLIELPLA